jgi:hypothetical protein
MDWQAKRLEGKVFTVRFIDSAGRSNERRDRVKDRNTYICGDCPSWRLFFVVFLAELAVFAHGPDADLFWKNP